MRKLAWFSGAFALAVLLCQYLLPPSVFLWCAAVCAAAALLAAFALRGGPRRFVLLISVGLALGLLWSLAAAALYHAPAQRLDGRTEAIVFVASDYSAATDYGAAVDGHILSEGRRVGTRLYLDEDPALAPGDRLELTARLRLTADGSGDYDYLTARGLFLLAYQSGETQLTRQEGFRLRDLPKRAARALKRSIDAAFPADAAALVKAVVTGDRSGLDAAFYARLQDAGLAHTIVVSGMHMGYLVAMLAILGKRRRRLAIIGIPVLLFFMAVTGFTPSVTRAGVMAVLALLGPALNRESDTPTSLTFSLLLLLLWNPYAIKSVSLQLSYASVAGILLFTERLQRALIARWSPRSRRLRRLLRYVWSSLATTLGAMALTTPLIALYFGRVLVLAPLANLLCLWALSLIFLLGLVVGLVGLVWPGLAALLMWLPWVFIRYFCAVAGWLGGLPFAVLPMSNDYLRAWCGFAYLTLLIVLCTRKWRGWLFVPLGGLSLTLCAALLLSEAGTGRLELIVADVGQGQCIVARLDGLTAVIDCGGTARGGEAACARDALARLNCGRVDYLILTHLHRDHAEEAALLMELVPVEHLLLPAEADDADGLLAEILAAAADRGTEVTTLTDVFCVDGGARSLTVYPPAGEKGNEQCLSVLLRCGDFDALVTGDLDRGGELQLLERYALPDLELLVVGHHGSASSAGEPLLDRLRPETAVISVGENNPYGHPAPELLRRLTERDIAVYRTDRQGDVRISVNTD